MSKAIFLKQFKDYNDHIESALSAQNFERVARLDTARREMLHQFAATATPDDDRHFFEALEECAADNARAITEMTGQMTAMRKSTGDTLRGLKGYRR
jgi:hypothetical protein